MFTKFKLLSDDRLIEVSKKIREKQEYKNPSDRGHELFQCIKEMLPPEGRKLLLELEECYSAEEATALETAYECGFKDALSIR